MPKKKQKKIQKNKKVIKKAAELYYLGKQTQNTYYCPVRGRDTKKITKTGENTADAAGKTGTGRKQTGKRERQEGAGKCKYSLANKVGRKGETAGYRRIQFSE